MRGTKNARSGKVVGAGSIHALFLACAVSTLSCRSRDEKVPEPAPTPSAGVSFPAPKTGGEKDEPQIASVFQLGSSAYRCALSVDDEVATLVTESAVYRIAPRKKPEKREIALGFDPVFTKLSVIFWKEGALQAYSKASGEVKLLGRVEEQPHMIVASDDGAAWLEKSKVGKYSVHSLQGGKRQKLYEASGSLLSAVMLKDWVFFVETEQPGTYRFGALPLSGRAPSFSSTKHGRTPSFLAVGGDSLYFFDLEGRSVVRLSPDLFEETVIAKNVVCSPLAVSDKIYCAQVEGLFSLSLSGGASETLTHEPLGLTTRIAASDHLLAWVSDSGKERLTIRLMMLRN